jgi:hypothetical protein
MKHKEKMIKMMEKIGEDVKVKDSGKGKKLAMPRC